MPGPQVEIISANKDEAAKTVATIVAAFITDPICRYAWPAAGTYLNIMPSVTEALGGASFELGTCFVSADFRGAALWLPPGVRPDNESLAGMMADTVSPDNQEELFQTFEQMAHAHPAEAHWYLPTIGVDPAAQGEGIGGALMRHATERFDAEQALSYLESSNPRNISLYLRHGFEVMGEIQVGSAPLVTPMLRQPR